MNFIFWHAIYNTYRYSSLPICIKSCYFPLQFFGYLAMVLYGGDAFLKYKALMAGELAQGHRVQAKQTHVTTPPALP